MSTPTIKLSLDEIGLLILADRMLLVLVKEEPSEKDLVVLDQAVELYHNIELGELAAKNLDLSSVTQGQLELCSKYGRVPRNDMLKFFCKLRNRIKNKSR